MRVTSATASATATASTSATAKHLRQRRMRRTMQHPIQGNGEGRGADVLMATNETNAGNWETKPGCDTVVSRRAAAFGAFGASMCTQRAEATEDGADARNQSSNAAAISTSGGLSQQAVAAILSIVAPGAYWWFVLVPSERRSLARSKRRGAVNEYLTSIEEDGQGRALERWFYTDWLKVRRGLRDRTRREASSSSLPNSSPDDSDRSTDTPMDDSSTATETDEVKVERIEERSSLDGTEAPAFLSLDNPLIATAIIIALGVLLAYLARSP